MSSDLTAEYGGGYSRSNHEYMRKFYLLYKNRIYQPLVGELPGSFQLSWSHYIQLLKIEDENERNFYEIEAIENSWAKRELIRQYNSAIYERIALSGNKKSLKELGKKGQIVEKPTDALNGSTTHKLH